jgi:transcriptional regulator with XRE-family HTH domain
MAKTTFGERLKIVRSLRGLTAKKVSEKCGLHFTAISLFENDKREPQASSLAKLAVGLNVSADYLLGLIKDTRSLG